VYILVVNARIEDTRDIDRIQYWLETIRIYTGNNTSRTKVFIIINESDDRKQSVDDYESLKSGEYGDLIQDSFSFNVGKDKKSVEGFKNILSDYIKSAGHQTFGQSDYSAMEQIKAHFSKNTQVLSLSDMDKIMSESGITSKKEQKRAKRLFNTLGVALNYDFMDGYVIDPYWISHGVYKVIDYLQKRKSKLIKLNELHKIFSDESRLYPDDKCEYIFKLMDYYKIGLRNKAGVQGLIVPCTASYLKPSDILVDIELENLIIDIERDESQELPADFFYKLISMNEAEIKKESENWAVWQTGMVLVEGGDHASALVELIRNRRIRFTIWGKNKEEYQDKLECLIDTLLKEYPYTVQKEERKRSGKTINVFVLALEAISYGMTKAALETGLNRMIPK
jgi:hypothetical protein